MNDTSLSSGSVAHSSVGDKRKYSSTFTVYLFSGKYASKTPEYDPIKAHIFTMKRLFGGISELLHGQPLRFGWEDAIISLF
jgi:hypothetical protein